MLKRIISTAAVLSMLSVSSLAFAGQMNKFYVGADYNYNMFSVDKAEEKTYTANQVSFIKTDLSGLNVKFGYRWDSLGLEIGHTFMQSVKYLFTNASMEQTSYNNYVDAYYYHPLNQCLDIKAMVGVGALHTKNEISPNAGYVATGSLNRSYNKVKPRVGAGLQYYFAKCWSADLMYKFQSGNKYYKNMNSVALGMNYHF